MDIFYCDCEACQFHLCVSVLDIFDYLLLLFYF